MFLDESFKPRPEPHWFRILRCIFAIIFLLLILKYSFYENFGKILNEATTQKFTIPHGSELTIYVSMCANGIMGFDVQEFPLNSFNSNYLYQSTSKPNENCILYPYNFTIPDFPSNIHNFGLWVNANIPFNNVNNITINNNQLGDIINSFYNEKTNFNKIISSILPNNNLKLTILMSLYLSDTSVRAQNCYSLNSNAFYFYPNQASFIHVTPSIISYLSGKCVIELDLRSEQLPLNLDTNKVGLGIYVNLPNKYEGYKVYSFTDYLSDLGGFYSFIEGIFSFIFGSGKLEPWGKAQILFLFGIPYIIKYSKDLVSSSGGIPLAEKVKVISEKDDNKSIESLRERVQTLETLLKEYYLDDYYLVKVKDLKIHRDGLMKHLEKV